MRTCWPDGYVPLYGCSECCRDFASLAAFDRHRVGRHEPDERRCLDDDELAAAGLAVLDGDGLAASQYASRARFDVVLVHDPQAAQRAREAFSR